MIFELFLTIDQLTEIKEWCKENIKFYTNIEYPKLIDWYDTDDACWLFGFEYKDKNECGGILSMAEWYKGDNEIPIKIEVADKEAMLFKLTWGGL